MFFLVLEVGKDMLGDRVIEFGGDMVVNVNIERNKVSGNGPVEFIHKGSVFSTILTN